jgi:acyl carrier protein
MQLENQLIALIAGTFSVDPATLHAESGQEDLKAWDSLGHLRLIMQVEAGFGVAFSIDEIPTLTSVSKIAAGIRAKQTGG